MHFDKEYNMKLEDMMKNSVRNSSKRCLLGSNDNPALDLFSQGKYHTHLVNTYFGPRTVIYCYEL